MIKGMTVNKYDGLALAVNDVIDVYSINDHRFFDDFYDYTD